ncbi:hypothetical protein [Parapedobacter sp. 10938]|uniref:hypothetical protein n=1 Tax=Parapedobacter flavus TaxID=3110225 RepID=UPI002DB85BEC|nr:hypothetical protein [Parapedobacter sp. 10938]MEC3881994.1 hypothetical protein [Parapedobacter sp. 10938]
MSILITLEAIAAIEYDMRRTGIVCQDLSGELLYRSASQCILSLEQRLDFPSTMPKGALSWLRSYQTMLMISGETCVYETITYLIYQDMGWRGVEQQAMGLTNLFECKTAATAFQSEMELENEVLQFVKSYIEEEALYI